MSVLIKGIGMPKDGEHPYWVVIHSDGTVEYNENKGQGWQTSEAVHVPPHGRLIDADALIEGIEADAIWEDCATDEYADGIRAGARVIMESIRNAPTIISAEEGE